jgi:hypothetical protein
MNLGTRRIRSAGRSSGSIEVTLPAQLQDFEGVECRLVVRDGPRPEIVLQPDLSAVQSQFRELWSLVGVGLADVGEPGELRLADFGLCLFPGGAWGERPPLAFADALAVLRRRADGAQDALARLAAAMGVVAGQRLGLTGPMALAFGDALAYLVVGAPAGPGAEFERGMAHQRFGEVATEALGAPLERQTWERARPGLRRVFEQFADWQEHPATHVAARERWFRALIMEDVKA